MHSGLFWWGLALALGALCGLLVAQASLRLPGPPAPVSRRRLAFCRGACLAGAAGAASWSPGPLGLVTTVLAAQLVLIGLLDAEHFWLPHRLTVPLGLMGLAE